MYFYGGPIPLFRSCMGTADGCPGNRLEPFYLDFLSIDFADAVFPHFHPGERTVNSHDLLFFLFVEHRQDIGDSQLLRGLFRLISGSDNVSRASSLSLWASKTSSRLLIKRPRIFLIRSDLSMVPPLFQHHVSKYHRRLPSFQRLPRIRSGDARAACGRGLKTRTAVRRESRPRSIP